MYCAVRRCLVTHWTKIHGRGYVCIPEDFTSNARMVIVRCWGWWLFLSWCVSSFAGKSIESTQVHTQIASEVNNSSSNSTNVDGKKEGVNNSLRKYEMVNKALNDSLFLCQVNKTLLRLRDNCMYTWLYENPDLYIPFPGEYIFPKDAEDHYNKINQVAQRYRGIPYHEYSNYSGPWIENIWIENFSPRPLSSFNGMIPLFFNWVDAFLKNKLPEITGLLNILLRPNVLYVTVSQSAEGLGQFSLLHPNLLVLSAGGFGHIPLPLVKGKEDFHPPLSKYAIDVSFVGSNRNERTALIRKTFEVAAKIGFSTKQILSTKLWRDIIYHTKFNLAPRGFGRTSFRLAEIIQMGRVPVYLYNDVPWIPYLGTNVSFEALHLSSSYQSIDRLISFLHKLSTNQSDWLHLQTQLNNVRYLYTYEGVIEQISLFFQDPLQAGYLRCVPFPRTIVCCG